MFVNSYLIQLNLTNLIVFNIFTLNKCQSSAPMETKYFTTTSPLFAEATASPISVYLVP